MNLKSIQTLQYYVFFVKDTNELYLHKFYKKIKSWMGSIVLYQFGDINSRYF